VKELTMAGDDRRIQAEIGGAARVDPGTGVQRPGYMIRDFTLRSSWGEDLRMSSFRGRTNLVLVFAGQSDAMRGFLSEMAQRSREFSEQETRVVAILVRSREVRSVPTSDDSPILELYDETMNVHLLSGATDENVCPVPLVYVTDRFGEIVATYSAPDHALPPKVDEILRTLEFVNHQCPECEPPEWPR